jgi:hypothetical protein
MPSICFYVVCGSYCGVFYVSVGIYIHIACMFGKCIMGYEYFIYSTDMCLALSI